MRLSRRHIMSMSALFSLSGLGFIGCSREETAINRFMGENYMMSTVSFESEGERVAGHLYVPVNLSAPVPGVVIIGPMTYAKEQAPTQYARRLAAHGYVALVFDPRYRGESGGTPRCYENARAKVEDFKQAVTFLMGRSEVVASQIAGVGICMGCPELLQVAAEDHRVKVISTLAGHYRDQQADFVWLGEEERAHRQERGAQARTLFESTGETVTVPAVDPTRSDAGMPGEAVWNWYHPWAEVGIWENRYAVMSDADFMLFESASAAMQVQQPYLMIHSDNSAIPDAARRHFDLVPHTEKKLLWEGQTQHFQYYDDPAIIDRAVDSISRWFTQHLK